MIQTYLINFLIGGSIGILSYFLFAGQSNFIAVLLLILLVLSYPARLVISRNLPSIMFTGKSNLRRLGLIPLFLYAAIADFICIVSSMMILKPNSEGAWGTPVSIIVVALIFGSIFIIFKEAVFAFSRNQRKNSKKLVAISKWIVYAYTALAVSVIWTSYGEKLEFTLQDQDLTKGLGNAFLFFLVVLLPFERHLIMEKSRLGVKWIHIFLSMALSFGLVIWTLLI